MKKILSKIRVPNLSPALGLGDALFSKILGAYDAVSGTFDTGVGLLKSTLGGIPFFGSTATSKVYDSTQTDEKHYFLVPDEKSEQGFSLHVIRCLPTGVPPINELPKRRLLHLPNAHALPMLTDIVVKEARQAAEGKAVDKRAIITNLESLINEIDKVDDKAFNGVLLLGGLIALVNPLAGATVAMKAMVPTVGLIVSKYGLSFASETATNIDVANRIRRAEKDIKKQFKEANTTSVINPLLRHVGDESAFDNWMSEPENFKFQCDDIAFSQADLKRFLDLSRQAVLDVTEDNISDDYFKQISDIALFE